MLLIEGETVNRQGYGKTGEWCEVLQAKQTFFSMHCSNESIRG